MSAIIQAIVIFFLLILVHEFGHYIVAKKSGTHVYEFAIGMGPLIRSFEKKGTRYSLRLIPIGGYVRLEGEDEETESPTGFSHQPPWKKFLILFAGAFMNFLLAWVVFFLLFSILGEATTEIDQIIPESAAEIHGFQSGDRIIEFQGVAIETWDHLSDAIKETTANQPVSVTLLRNGSETSLSLQMGEGENGHGSIDWIFPRINSRQSRGRCRCRTHRHCNHDWGSLSIRMACTAQSCRLDQHQPWIRESASNSSP